MGDGSRGGQAKEGAGESAVVLMDTVHGAVERVTENVLASREAKGGDIQICWSNWKGWRGRGLTGTARQVW